MATMFLVQGDGGLGAPERAPFVCRERTFGAQRVIEPRVEKIE